MVADWARKPIKNVLLDINGVLFNSGENHAIEGSVEAIKTLIERGFKFCLVTNECTTPKRLLAEKLKSLGFVGIEPSNIVSPAPVACRFIQQFRLTPRLHVSDSIMEDFEPVLESLKNTDKAPDCLVVGDVMDKLSRDFVDESLELMLNCPKKPYIISLGEGRYYKDAGRLRMDTGAFTKAFEYCLGTEAVNMGKPSRDFFDIALETIDGALEDSVMIGDDILSDVNAAQRAGMRGFLVRTGKYRRSDETEPLNKADHVFDDLRDAINSICMQTW